MQEDVEGFGSATAVEGDLLLVNYTGRVLGDEFKTVFDTTQGADYGLKYRDGGKGVSRPVVVRLNLVGDDVPGQTTGLKQALIGIEHI